MADLIKDMQEAPLQPSFTLSSQNLKLLSERFGGKHHYGNSTVGLTDDRMRQLAEHFTP